MISGLSRSNRPVVRNGLVRRRLTFPTNGTWGVQQASSAVPRDVLTVDSTAVTTGGKLVLTSPTSSSSPFLLPIDGCVKFGRLDLSPSPQVTIGNNAQIYGMGLCAAGGIYWSSSSTDSSLSAALSAANGSITVESANSYQFGLDAASPSNQTLKACDGVGTDKAGANFTIASGRPTGAGTEGKVVVQTAAAAGASATPGTLVTRTSTDSVAFSALVPVQLNSYTVAQATAALAIACPRGLIWVSNESGGACPAISDGATFRKIALGATIS